MRIRPGQLALGLCLLSLGAVSGLHATGTPGPSFQSLGIPTATASPTPSASDLYSPTASPTPVPTLVPTRQIIFQAPSAVSGTASFPLSLPSVPTDLSGSFSILTDTGKAQPSVHLEWEDSDPGSYAILGYKILRREAGGGTDFSPCLGPNSVSADPLYDDPVDLGKVYEYEVVAIDAKGNSSAPSAATQVDGAHLSDSILQPRAPQDLTATSARISAKLKWNPPAPWLAPISGYRVFRSGSSIGPRMITQTSYEDISPTSKIDFIYSVVSIDANGRLSDPSNTVVARATGALPPTEPKDLSITVYPEKVELKWDKSDPGTAAVTEYLLYRIQEPSHGDIPKESRKNLGPLDLSQTSFTDNLDGDHYYRYELAAVDAESNTSTYVKVRSWVPSKPFNKTSIMEMPTAFSNFEHTDLGINVNVIFDLYIGALYESYTSPITGPTSHIFQQLGDQGQLAVVSLDLKESFIPETWLTPGVAFGFYGSALLPFGGSGGTVAVSSQTGGLSTVGNMYVVASKRLGQRNAILTVGYMQGDIANLLVGAMPSDWGPTLRHLTPSGDYPDLFTRFMDPTLGVEPEQASDMAFAGIIYPFTLPLGFTNWKSTLKLEVMEPLAPGQPIVDDDSGIVEDSAGLPLVWNLHFDHLPLFGFEFSLFQFEGGYELLAFYHFSDLTWAF